MQYPVTRKHSSCGFIRMNNLNHTKCIQPLHWGLSGMQGYRKGMEDATVAAKLPNDDGSSNLASLFCVFDGHGGSCVASSCAKAIRPAVSTKFRKHLENTNVAGGLPSDKLFASALVDAYETVDCNLVQDPTMIRNQEPSNHRANKYAYGVKLQLFLSNSRGACTTIHSFVLQMREHSSKCDCKRHSYHLRQCGRFKVGSTTCCECV